MAFDGQDDYISIPGIHLQTFTFSALVRPLRGTSSLNNQRLLLLDGDKGYYALQASSSGTLEFRASIHGRAAGIGEHDRQSQIDGWTVIAVTCDGFTVRLYRNGELTGQGSILGDDVAGGAYIGGTDAYGGRFWHGMIDEVALFNRSLSPQQVRDLHRITAKRALHRYLSAPEQKVFSDELMAVEVPERSKDMVLYYSFDADYGDEVLDQSGRGHHAQAHGTRYVNEGRSGGALSFDGQDDFLSARDIHLENFTFSAFVKTLLPANKPNTNNRRVFLLYDGPRYYALQGNSRGSIGLDVTGHRGVDEYDWGFEAHTWTHIAVTYERPTVKLYKNGKLTEVGRVDVDGVRGTLYIGGTEKHWGRFWHGLIDEVVVLNRALSSEGIEKLFRMRGEPEVATAGRERSVWVLFNDFMNGRLGWSDIGALLELGQSEAVVSQPSNPISSLAGGRGPEGMVALWLIEAMRNQVKSEAHPMKCLFPTPVCWKREMARREDSEEWERNYEACQKSAEIHRQVLQAYEKWWEQVKSLSPKEAALLDPLDGTDLVWHGVILK